MLTGVIILPFAALSQTDVGFFFFLAFDPYLDRPFVRKNQEALEVAVNAWRSLNTELCGNFGNGKKQPKRYFLGDAEGQGFRLEWPLLPAARKERK